MDVKTVTSSSLVGTNQGLHIKLTKPMTDMEPREPRSCVQADLIPGPWRRWFNECFSVLLWLEEAAVVIPTLLESRLSLTIDLEV